jgi:hypothetical protein
MLGPAIHVFDTMGGHLHSPHHSKKRRAPNADMSQFYFLNSLHPDRRTIIVQAIVQVKHHPEPGRTQEICWRLLTPATISRSTVDIVGIGLFRVYIVLDDSIVRRSHLGKEELACFRTVHDAPARLSHSCNQLCSHNRTHSSSRVCT